MAKPDGALFRDLLDTGDVTVLVNLAQSTRDLAFFVVPTMVLNNLLVSEFAGWVRTPGKNGRPHDPTNRKRNFGYRQHADTLEGYRDNWESLWEASGRRTTG